MSFLSPWWLLALVIPLLMVVGLLVARRRRQVYALRFTQLDLLDEIAPERPGWRRVVPAALSVLAAASLVVGLARPVIERQVPDPRAVVVLAVDVSLSMAADDVDPDRITAAKQAALTFVASVPDEVRVGLVAFSAVASPLVAPTTDRTALSAAVNGLRLGEGTAIGEAIFAGLELIDASRPLEQTEPTPAAVVVLSDGETTAGRPDGMAVEAAVSAGVPVSTIAFGTDEGVVELPDGSAQPVPVDAEALAGIARDGGGAFSAALTADELDAILGDLGGDVGRRVEEREISTWFLVLSLAAAAVAAASSLRWFARFP